MYIQLLLFISLLATIFYLSEKNMALHLYKILLHDLKKQVDTGYYKQGDYIPSENELCKMYDTTRPTVRQALNELVKMGYIVKQHGKGSIVSEPKNGLGILSLKGTSAGIGKKNLKTKILIKPRKDNWPNNFPYKLSEVQLKSGCIYLTRLRYIDNAPVLYEETYITDFNLPRFTVHNLEKHSLFETLKKFHKVEIKGGEQKIWAIKANERITDLLRVKKNIPILHMKRSLLTNVKELKLYSILYCNTSEWYIQDYV